MTTSPSRVPWANSVNCSLVGVIATRLPSLVLQVPEHAIAVRCRWFDQLAHSEASMR